MENPSQPLSRAARDFAYRVLVNAGDERALANLERSGTIVGRDFLGAALRVTMPALDNDLDDIREVGAEIGRQCSAQVVLDVLARHSPAPSLPAATGDQAVAGLVRAALAMHPNELGATLDRLHGADRWSAMVLEDVDAGLWSGVRVVDVLGSRPAGFFGSDLCDSRVVIDEEVLSYLMAWARPPFPTGSRTRVVTPGALELWLEEYNDCLSDLVLRVEDADVIDLLIDRCGNRPDVQAALAWRSDDMTDEQYRRYVALVVAAVQSGDPAALSPDTSQAAYDLHCGGRGFEDFEQFAYVCLGSAVALERPSNQPSPTTTWASALRAKLDRHTSNVHVTLNQQSVQLRALVDMHGWLQRVNPGLARDLRDAAAGAQLECPDLSRSSAASCSPARREYCDLVVELVWPRHLGVGTGSWGTYLSWRLAERLGDLADAETLRLGHTLCLEWQGSFASLLETTAQLAVNSARSLA